MTSRERILAAIEHREPDRVPIDLGSHPSSNISAIAYGRLTRHLGVGESHTRVYDVVQQLAQPEDAILDRFGVDVVDIGRAFNTRDEDWRDITLRDGQPAQYPAWFHPERQHDGSWIVRHDTGLEIARMPATSAFFDQTCFPWAEGYPDDVRAGLEEAMGKVMWGALAPSPWDHAAEPDFWVSLRERALALAGSTGRARLMGVGCNLFEWGTFIRRLDNFLADLLLAPAQVERLLDALLERHLATLEKICASVGDVADIVKFGDDLGTDVGPFMSPAAYRRFFKPRHAQLCDYAHRNSRMKTCLHSCGSIYRLLPDLIEAGFDVINPVQTSTRDMEPERLKREFGKDVCFWGGGCDTRRVLNMGTPAEVRDHVRRQVDIFAPGGGFVFCAIHNILPEVPPENVVAMFDAVLG
ncbi:MAG: uroporphyrinogen decarboxylase family protein [Bacteroidales bacterium]